MPKKPYQLATAMLARYCGELVASEFAPRDVIHALKISILGMEHLYSDADSSNGIEDAIKELLVNKGATVKTYGTNASGMGNVLKEMMERDMSEFFKEDPACDCSGCVARRRREAEGHRHQDDGA